LRRRKLGGRWGALQGALRKEGGSARVIIISGFGARDCGTRGNVRWRLLTCIDDDDYEEKRALFVTFRWYKH